MCCKFTYVVNTWTLDYVFVLLLSSGRKVAVDASMSIYQFLIAVRQDGSTLTNAEGETTR